MLFSLYMLFCLYILPTVLAVTSDRVQHSPIRSVSGEHCTTVMLVRPVAQVRAEHVAERDAMIVPVAMIIAA